MPLNILLMLWRVGYYNLCYR